MPDLARGIGGSGEGLAVASYATVNDIEESSRGPATTSTTTPRGLAVSVPIEALAAALSCCVPT